MTEEENQRRFTPPWSSSGPFGDSVRRGQDPEVLRLYTVAGKGRVNPIGFTADKPALAMTPATHNPYLQLPLALISGLVGVFLYNQFLPNIVGAVAGGSFFIAGALVIAFMRIRQIPSWHRARKLVRAYSDKTGAKFPDELRWYR